MCERASQRQDPNGPQKPASKAPRASHQLTDFDIVTRLGDGSFSQVVQVVLKCSGVHYALKIVDKHLILRHKQVDYIRRERQLLDRLDDPGIVRLYFTFQDDSSLYFGLELCPNGELYDQIQRKQRLPVPEAQFYAAEIVLILIYLRSEQIVHRDLKPENLLLTAEGHLKLIDFGCAKDLAEAARAEPDQGGSKRAASLVGTADYLSPETLGNKAVGCEADLWAFGCIVFQMITGRPPFKAASEYLTFQKVAAAEYTLPEDVPEDARDLINQLLNLEPANRLGSGPGGLERLQRHPFFEGVEWERLRSQKAPEIAARPKAADDTDDDGFDWELSSLAASLPLRYEYETGGKSEKDGDIDKISALQSGVPPQTDSGI